MSGEGSDDKRVRIADEPPKEPGPRVRVAEPSLVDKMKAAPVTFALATINVTVMAVIALRGGDARMNGTLLQYGADEALHVWSGEYWRLFTAMFLHVGWIHLLVNTYASIGWCMDVERALGKRRFLLVYVLSGLGGNFVSIAGAHAFAAINPERWPLGVPSAGASGALFGVVGATFAIRRFQLGSFKAFTSDPFIRANVRNIAIWTVIGLTAVNMDNRAHFGGLIVGALTTWILVALRGRRFAWPVFAVAFVALFILAVRPWWSPPNGPADTQYGSFANAWILGKRRTTDGFVPWPRNVDRGVRMAEKGCARSGAFSCLVLAAHLQSSDDEATRQRGNELFERACALDARVCAQRD